MGWLGIWNDLLVRELVAFKDRFIYADQEAFEVVEANVGADKCSTTIGQGRIEVGGLTDLGGCFVMYLALVWCLG